MTIDDLYALVDRLLPPVAVALLAFVTTAVVLARAVRGRRPRAAIIAAGTGNVGLVYLWTHLAGLSTQERAMGVRLAIVFLHICILVYLVRVRPLLAKMRRRGRHHE